MEKPIKKFKKLELKREVIASLDDKNMEAVRGGYAAYGGINQSRGCTGGTCATNCNCTVGTCLTCQTKCVC